MSSQPPFNPREQLAAEYVLGVLDGAKRADAERAVRDDASFAALVTEWNERLAPLLDEIAPAEPGPELWLRINAALDAEGARPANVVSMERSLRRWRGMAAAMTAVAASLLMLVLTVPPSATLGPPSPPAPTPIVQPAPMTAAIGDKGATSFVVAWSPGDRTMMVVPATVPPVDDRSHELWLIPDGEAPISLGVVDAGRPMRLTVPAALAARFDTTATLAVSTEPTGGSPTGQPTGPVIGSGKLQSA